MRRMDLQSLAGCAIGHVTRGLSLRSLQTPSPPLRGLLHPKRASADVVFDGNRTVKGIDMDVGDRNGAASMTCQELADDNSDAETDAGSNSDQSEGPVAAFDIDAANEEERTRMVALQGQLATSLSLAAYIEHEIDFIRNHKQPPHEAVAPSPKRLSDVSTSRRSTRRQNSGA